MVSDNFTTNEFVGKKQAGLAGVGLAISEIANTSDSDQKCKNEKPRVSVVFIVDKIALVEIGDRFVSIDNDNVEEKTAKEVGNKLVGPMGSHVQVTFRRLNGMDYNVTLERNFRYVACHPDTYESTGIGLLLDAKKDLQIVGIIEGSDSSEGGVALDRKSNNKPSEDQTWVVSNRDGTFRIGDTIVAIDGQRPLSGNNQDHVLNLFSEPEGSLMIIDLHRTTGQPEELRVAIRRGTTRCPCNVWVPVPDEARPDPASRFSDAEERAMAALSARHTCCDFHKHPTDLPTIEWDEIWSDSKPRDPFGECRIKELGDSLRRRRQQDPSCALFIDPYFPHHAESLLARRAGASAEKPFLSAETLAGVEWKRPAEMLSPHDTPQVWLASISEDDVKQGGLNNCYLLAALSACATGKKDLLVRDLCIEDYADVGLYGIKFFVMGRWVTVFIDDCIPCTRGSEGLWEPLFASPKNGVGGGVKVLWPMLFEKAFAKLHRSYECTQLGSVADALQYLTGGVVMEELLGVRPPDDEWAMLKAALADAGGGERLAFVACGISALDGASQITDEELKDKELVRHHAYSVVRTLESVAGCPAHRDVPLRLVLIRNPWANSKEWQGNYGDNDTKAWRSKDKDSESELAREAKFKSKNDGLFWMEHSDFRKFFDYLQICKPTSILRSHGPRRVVRVSGVASYWVARKSAGGNAEHWKDSKVSAFEYNPKFEIQSLGEPVLVTVYQPDTRYSSKKLDSRQISKTVEPMMDIFVYVRDDSSPNWKLEMQLYGGPQGDRACACTLLKKKRCEIMVTTKDPGVQGPFSITATGEGCLLTPCKVETPPPSISKLMTAKSKERWTYDSKLKSKKQKRQEGFAPVVAVAAAASGSTSPLLTLFAALTILGGSSLYGGGGLGPLEFSYSPQTLTLQTGQSLSVSHNSGKQLQNNSVIFSVTPSLPRGLVLDKATGRITGLTSYVCNSSWNVTVKNISGRELASTTFGLTVLQTPLKYESKLFSFKIQNVVSVIPRIEFDTVGSKFSIIPALPKGLAMSNDGSISGIPVSISAPSVYEVRAENLYTQYVASLRLEIIPDYAAELVEKAKREAIERSEFRSSIIKEMHYSDSSSGTSDREHIFTYFLGKRMVPEIRALGPKFTESNISGNFQFKSDGGLPLGLLLSESDGTISGVPRVLSAAQVWNISFSLDGELWTLLKLPLQVIDANKVSLKVNELSFRRGELVFTPLYPQFDCSGILNITVVPALPKNLKFTSRPQCGLSGSASVVSDPKEHAVLIHWKSGFASFKFGLEVLEPLAQLEYSKLTGTYLVGVGIPQIFPLYASGQAGKEVLNFSVQPRLPQGISLEKSSGIISGTPKAAKKLSVYTITVQNKAGDSKQCELSVEVVDQTGIQATYSKKPIYLALNESFILPLKVRPALNWVLDNAVFDIFPPLPLGMKLGAKGSIEGAPLFAKKLEAYSVRIAYPFAPDAYVANGFGQVQALASLSVVKRIKYLCYDVLDAYYTVGRRIKQNRPVFDKSCGAVTFRVTPKLPAGLKLDEITGIISGAPTATQDPFFFVVTATNPIGDVVTVRIRIEICQKSKATPKMKTDPVLLSCGNETSTVSSPLDLKLISSSMSAVFMSSRRYIF